MYGSHWVALDDAGVAFDGPADPAFARCCAGLQTCVAAFAAAVGGLPLRVVTILLESPRSFWPPDLNVLSMPAECFSGLGVRALGRSVVGAASLGGVVV